MRERPAPALRPKRLRVLLLVCALSAFCLPHVAAQSGRRTTSKVSPAPSPEASAAASSDNPSTRISAVVIGGHDVDPETKETYSNTVSHAVKACTARLKEHRGPTMNIRNGGKMTRAEAVELAKRETGAYVLWFGYRTRRVDLFYDTVEYMDYVVLMPKTAQTLTEGRVYPDRQKKTVDPGGVMRLPGVRRQERPPNAFRQLETGAREIADRVKNKL